MFNEYGAAKEALNDFSDYIFREFNEFLEYNRVDDPVEIRAVSNYVESSIQIAAAEKVLKIAIKKRKENRDKNT